jgi:hypothetical protein
MKPVTVTHNSVDAVIELYKQDIDVTLIEANLRLTIDERIAQLQRLFEFAEELHCAPRAKRARRSRKPSKSLRNSR